MVKHYARTLAIGIAPSAAIRIIALRHGRQLRIPISCTDREARAARSPRRGLRGLPSGDAGPVSPGASGRSSRTIPGRG